jgi:ATP-binding cassette subfamily B (MDR/TAP) protein 1
LFTTIKRKPEIDPDDTTSGKQLEDMRGDIDLKDVYFSYPARPEQLIFDGFTLHVPSGTTMAIVGESGSGKSTVISLVERFYDPQAGEVLIDGINIKSLQLGWIRGKIGLVSQEPLLLMTSIKDNIAYGKEDATIEEIKRAAELANAANFIDKLPNVYEKKPNKSTSIFYIFCLTKVLTFSFFPPHTRTMTRWLVSVVLSSLGGKNKGLLLPEQSLETPKSFC